MNKRLLSPITALFVIWIACSCASTKNMGIQEVNTIKIETQDETFLPAKSFRDISCIQLETTEESILGKINNIIPTDSSLVILSDNEIFLFNKNNGNFIRKIGSLGEGPEDYLMVQDIYYDSDKNQIGIYDKYKNEFLFYNLSGQFIGKEKPVRNLFYMQSMERTSDGTILTCNRLTPPDSSFDNAFTLIREDNEPVEIDPFKPIFVKDYTATWAYRPMSKCHNELKFVKMFTDSIYSINHGQITPLYKIDFGKQVPSKEMISHLGQFPGNPSYVGFCRNNNYLSGINKMYETTDYIILFPQQDAVEGYYWIDKNNDKGYHIKSSPRFDYDAKSVLEGKSIVNVEGSNEHEIVSCFESEYSPITFRKVIEANKENIFLPQEVITKLLSIDPEGNPFLIIYSK